MLFVVFQIGQDRYALDAGRVVQVVPLLALKRLPHAPKGVAGVFVYQGSPVPAVDLCELTLGRPAAEMLSTRIILVNFAAPGGEAHLLGLIAEKATEVLRKDPRDFVDSGINLKAAPYLGPVLADPKGPIHWLQEEHLVSGPVQKLLFASSPLVTPAAADRV